MGWRRGTMVVLAAASAVAGCGGSKFDGATLSLALYPATPVTAANRFSATIYDASGRCPLSPQATLTVTIDGATANADTTLPFGSCVGMSVQFDGNPSAMLQIVDGDDRAEMVVSGLDPGVEAAIVSPSDGQVAAGGSITVSLPPAFQGQVPQYADFENTSEADGYAGMLTYPTASDSQSVTFPAPQYPASYLLWLEMPPPVSASSLTADVQSCAGLARCYSGALELLGPMTITVTP